MATDQIAERRGILGGRVLFCDTGPDKVADCLSSIYRTPPVLLSTLHAVGAGGVVSDDPLAHTHETRVDGLLERIILADKNIDCLWTAPHANFGY